MKLIETDLILSAVSREDKHHRTSVKLIEKLSGELVLSPYTLIELNLLLKIGKIVVTNVEDFYTHLDAFLNYWGIEVQALKVTYHKKAHQIREEYGLRYFDSLHAAVGIIEGLELVSYDRSYTKIPELAYSHPAVYVR